MSSHPHDRYNFGINWNGAYFAAHHRLGWPGRNRHQSSVRLGTRIGCRRHGLEDHHTIAQRTGMVNYRLSGGWQRIGRECRRFERHSLDSRKEKERAKLGQCLVTR